MTKLVGNAELLKTVKGKTGGEPSAKGFHSAQCMDYKRANATWC